MSIVLVIYEYVLGLSCCWRHVVDCNFEIKLPYFVDAVPSLLCLELNGFSLDCRIERM